MRNKNKSSFLKPPDSASIPPRDHCCIEGEPLAAFLKSIRRGIESAKNESGGESSLPEKFWFKQQFAIGVNEVTRVLERMSPAATTENPKAPSVQLQAVLVASDCNPKWLSKHLPSLALSRKVPLIFVKGDKKGGGSLRLGELVNLKTAIAVGVKAKGSAVNQCVEPIVCSSSSRNGISNETEQLMMPSALMDR